jgi:hypothetical protein
VSYCREPLQHEMMARRMNATSILAYRVKSRARRGKVRLRPPCLPGGIWRTCKHLILRRVSGCQNVARGAIERNVQTVIGISTAKATPLAGFNQILHALQGPC